MQRVQIARTCHVLVYTVGKTHLCLTDLTPKETTCDSYVSKAISEANTQNKYANIALHTIGAADLL